MINRNEHKSQPLLTEGAKIYRRHLSYWEVRSAGKTTVGFFSSLGQLKKDQSAALREIMICIDLQGSDAEFTWFKGCEL